MSLKLGVHNGSLEMAFADLSRLCLRAEEAGFDWFSVSDHLYANPIREHKEPCLEGVASLAALSAISTRMRMGCLVFCSLFRSPGLLAKAAVTIDHISNGRAEIGIGAGWFETEFKDFGYPFPPLKERMDQQEEALQVVRELLQGEPISFHGKYYQYEGTICTPRPVQQKLRIWVGGRGPKRTPRLAARYADGFNVAYLSAAEYGVRVQALERACEKIGRDPAEVERSVNLGFYMGADEAAAERNRKEVARFDAVRATGMLTGTPAEAVEKLAQYEKAGAQGLNIAFRAPIDWDAFEAFIEEVLPHFHGGN